MKGSNKSLWKPFALAVTLAGCATGLDEDETRGVTIAVAPLTLPGIGVACYDVAVMAAGDALVWSRGDPALTLLGHDQTAPPDPTAPPEAAADTTTLCSDRFGNATGGSISYVGPCDASLDADTDLDRPGVQNTVTLWVDGLYNAARTAEVGGWMDPCPDGCAIEVDCQENADSVASFNLTLMRDAHQGFFDVAVNFETIFCSAKLDTCYPDSDGDGPGELIRLLHGAGPERDWTAVFGFACTAGTGDADTTLLYGPITIACGDTVFGIDPTGAEGRHSLTVDDATLHYGIYRGIEDLPCDTTSCNKAYWNLAFSLDDLDALGGACALTLSATAADGVSGFDAGLPVQPDAAYPYIEVSATLTPPTCQRHPLNAGPTVRTAYRGDLGGLAPPDTMCAGFSATGVAPLDDVDCLPVLAPIAWLTHLGAETHVPGWNNAGDEIVRGMTLDPSGHVYLVGDTTGSMGEANGGSRDLFVAKLSPQGALLWVRQLGATTVAPGGSNAGQELGIGIALDSTGNILAVGSTTGSVGEQNGGDQDALVVKLSPEGAPLWVRQLGAVTPVPGGDTTRRDQLVSVAIAADDAIIATGQTRGSLGEAHGGGIRDLFFWKLDPTGADVWVRQLGANTVAPGGDNAGDELTTAATLDDDGDLVFVGSSNGSMGEANAGLWDAIVGKLDQDGDLVWLTQLGALTGAPGGDNSANDVFTGVAVDGAGDIVIAGRTEGAMAEPNAGQYDMAFAKLNGAGDLLWVRQLGALTAAPGGDNSGNDLAQSVRIGPDGHIYGFGQTSGSMGELNGGDVDMVFVKLAPNGLLEGVRQLGAVTAAPGGDHSAADICLDGAVDDAGDLYCAGHTHGAMGEAHGGGLRDAVVVKLHGSSAF